MSGKWRAEQAPPLREKASAKRETRAERREGVRCGFVLRMGIGMAIETEGPNGGRVCRPSPTGNGTDGRDGRL